MLFVEKFLLIAMSRTRKTLLKRKFQLKSGQLK